MKRKICFVSGTRADYGILTPVMRAVRDSNSLELCLVVTGMHLMKEFGWTIDEIAREGFEITEKVDISYQKDSGLEMAISVGKAVGGFAEAFGKIKPQIVVVLGDRGEMLAAAIAANYLNIPVAHIHGGEVSGHVDGLLRHAITKLSHLHFPATQEAKQRIISLGEEPWRVKVSGAPALDRILHEKLPPKATVFKKYNLKTNEKTILLVQHPVLVEAKSAQSQIKETLEAVKDVGLQTVIIYPNADAGGREMIKEIEKYRGLKNFHIFKNIPQKDYLAILKYVGLLVGNSSSGIIEAPAFAVPVINIGSRQWGRQRACNVIQATYKKDEIVKAIRKILNPNSEFKIALSKCQSPYGRGDAGEIIEKVLSSIPIDQRLLNKKITY